MSVDPTGWNSNLTLKMTIQTMTRYCILPVDESHFKSCLATSTVSAHFWVAISNVCKLQWRGLDNVAGGNLSATLQMLQKGFGGCRCVSAWEECKCSAETTPHMHLHPHTHPHIFPFFIVLLFFSVSLSPPPSHRLLSWAVRFSLVNQNICRRHNVLTLYFTLSSSSRAPTPTFFLDVPFDLFALTFLFKQAHEAIFAQLVTSWPVNVQCRSSTCLHNDTVLTAYICFLSPSLSLSVSLTADLRWVCW